MKNAKITMESFSVSCPFCDEAIPAPCGSLFWTLAEYDTLDEKLKCRACGKASKFPKAGPY